MPMHRRVLGQLVRDEDPDLVALDRLDGRSGRLAVVAPQMGLHARRELAHDGLGDEVELLPLAVLAPRQGPAVERHHGLVIRPALRIERRLHRRFGHRGRLRQARGLGAPADHGGSGEGQTSGADEPPAGQVGHEISPQVSVRHQPPRRRQPGFPAALATAGPAAHKGGLEGPWRRSRSRGGR